MRESSKIDKTKLPVDVYEAWLRTQNTQPERRAHPEKHATDYYEAWLGQRVEVRTRENKAKGKRTAG